MLTDFENGHDLLIRLRRKNMLRVARRIERDRNALMGR